MASTGRARLRALGLIGLCGSLLLLAVGVAQASARSVTTHTLSKVIEGGELVEHPGLFEISSIAVDEHSGYVYVADRFPEITKFKSDGTLASWTAPGLAGATSIRANPFPPSNTNTETGTKLAVDNSNGPHQGRIYMIARGGAEEYIHAFEPNGEEVTEANSGENWPLTTADVTPAQFGPFNLTVDEQGNLWENEENGFLFWREFKSNGERGTVVRSETAGEGGWGLDTNHDVYLGNYYGTAKYNVGGELLYNLANFSGDLAVDRSDNDVYLVGKYGAENAEYISQYDSSGNRINKVNIGSPNTFNGRIAIDSSTNRLYWGDGSQLRIFAPGPTKVVPDVATESASNFQATSVDVHGSVNPDSVNTTSCKFEYGPTEFSPSKSEPCDQGNVLTGSGQQEVTATLSGLNEGSQYSYRLTVENAGGEVIGRSRHFIPSAVPVSQAAYITNVHADSATVHAEVDAGGAPATYKVEYGTQPCSANSCASTQELDAGSDAGFDSVSTKLEGLEGGMTYYYRISASNQSGPYTSSEEGTFTTFPRVTFGDNCPNAHVRQQTGSALLLDCRAYELVSAGNAGGYDVESDLSPGQEPLGGYPEAEGEALYSIHAGAIPGIGAPANLGPDPYLATRGSESWSTEYVGIPSDNPYAGKPFASSLLEASPSLSSFAFGGPNICAPCFADKSTNIPLRLSNGELVEGMVGGEKAFAEPSGYVGKHFSADGNHFVFGTEAKLEEAANSSGTDTTLYERNLSAGSTEVISTLPDETTMHNGTGVAELDISADGSRAVVGEAVGPPDGDGNQYYHLYMHIAGTRKSIDLTPGTTSGALFDGMTADGSMVYFTTKDPLSTATDQDTDTSADIFRADVTATAATLTRVTSGAGAGNTDACDPAGGWNSVEGGKNCDAVAIAGGGGVASGSGTIYFVSPEKLDNSGTVEPVQDQPNLYAANPGSAPRFVATVDTSVGKPPPPPPGHELANPSFLGGFETPGSLAVDQKTGDLYVGDNEKVSRWNANGEPVKFGATNSNVLGGVPFYGYGENQIAVDSSNSPLSGDMYVATNGEQVAVYNNEGEEVGALTGLGEACGVAVDQSNGDVYVGSYSDKITRFRPKAALVPPVTGVTNLSYEAQEGIHVSGGELCNIDVSAEGHVYEWPYYGGEVRQFATSSFDGSFPTQSGKAFGGGVSAANVQTDPSTGIVYVLTGSAVMAFEPDGTELEKFGSLEFSRGIGVDAKDERIYVGRETSGKILSFDAVATPYEVIDNPFVRHGVTQAAIHNYKDFQVTPSGRFAAFPTRQRLKESFDNSGHTEVYRYDDSGRELVCVSCNPSNAVAEGEASLPAKGLGLADDGRTFFNTADGITARDLDNKIDAYEYGKNRQGQEAPELISTGTSPFNSSLLGVTADGKDAFFFTRDTLVPQDQNGSLVKLYDAREGGGFEYFPEKARCKASDECHGPGTVQPPPPGIGTLQGAVGNQKGEGGSKPASCKHGLVRKNRRCVKRHHPKKTKKARHHHSHREGTPSNRARLGA